MDAVADLREKGRANFKAPVLFIQDGQALLTGFLLKEFYIDRDPVPPRDVIDPIKRNRLVEDMKYVASIMYDPIETTHTYFNTGSQGDLQRIRIVCYKRGSRRNICIIFYAVRHGETSRLI